MYYLYIKQHNITNKKYLGYSKYDPEGIDAPRQYNGSGLYWQRHINKYGKDISTFIIGSYETMKDLQEAGLYYSNIWDIVKSDDWLNLKEEKGQGAGNGSANRGNHNLGGWNRGLTINNPIIAANIKAMADATRGKKKPLEQRRKMSIAQKKRWAKTL